MIGASDDLSTAIDDARLARLLGGNHRAELRRRLRRHFTRVDPALAATQTLRLSALSRVEYEALAALMGRPPRAANSIELDIAAIDAALARANIAPSLRAALERLDGPIVHTPSVRATVEARWRAVAGRCAHPALAAFLATPAGLGLLKRLARQNPDAAGPLCDAVTAALKRLPAAGLTRAQLAAETLGDAHALDPGRPAASLVIGVLRRGLPTDGDRSDGETHPAAARDERIRALWARAGVLVNELARPALVLNLPVLGGGVAGNCPGEPFHLSLRALVRRPTVWDMRDRRVYICENPNVVAIAADRLGAACRPLVCTEGMPAAAQRTLLEQLVEAGARLAYHGDFDWPGLAIATVVMRTTRAAPWRFGAADYRLGVATAPDRPHRLAGRPVEANWDAALTSVMQELGIAIAEEAIVDVLLHDLGI